MPDLKQNGVLVPRWLAEVEARFHAQISFAIDQANLDAWKELIPYWRRRDGVVIERGVALKAKLNVRGIPVLSDILIGAAQ